QPDGPDGPACARRSSRPRRGRLREGEPALFGPGLGADAAPPLSRERRAVAADEDRLGLLARRGLAVGLHGDRAADAGPPRPRPDLHALRLPERHARPPERVERAGPGRGLEAGLRRRRALRYPPDACRPGDLVAALQGLPLAPAGEVRDPGLP